LRAALYDNISTPLKEEFASVVDGMPLSNVVGEAGDAQLFLLAKGGNGGRGQDGHDGIKGATGEQGNFYSSYFPHPNAYFR